MSGKYLTLDELGEVVRTCTGVDVDSATVATSRVTVSELGIDSLGWLGVITALENQYGVTLGSQAETVATLPEMVVLVNGALAGGERTPGHTDNAIVINAPLDLVWDMTNDVEGWPQLFTEYAEATIIERDGDTVRFRLATHPDESGATYAWVSERTPDRETLTVKAQRIETGVFEFMFITWTYREVEGGVEMRWVQDFAMKPTAPADNDGATDYINRNSVTQQAHIKQVVEAAAAERAA